jgi:hypothetical protein
MNALCRNTLRSTSLSGPIILSTLGKVVNRLEEELKYRTSLDVVDRAGAITLCMTQLAGVSLRLRSWPLWAG